MLAVDALSTIDVRCVRIISTPANRSVRRVAKASRKCREVVMVGQGSRHAAVIALLTALATWTVPAAAADAKYPNWKGQWIPVIPAAVADKRMSFDPSKPAGLGQQAPLTQEYQKVFN